MDKRRRRPLRLGQWLQIVAAGILGMVVALVIASLQTSVYQSDTRFFVSATGGLQAANSQAADFVQARVTSYPAVVDSEQVMQAVINQLHLSTTPADLAKKVTATVPVGTAVMDVTVSDSTAAGAQNIAKGIATVLPPYIERLESGGTKTSPVNVTTVQAPTLPSAPSSPNKTLDLILGLVVGLAGGAAWVLWRASRDETIRSAADVESAVGAKVLSEIPGGSDLRPATPGAPLGAGWDSPRSEAYRKLRTSLQFKADSDRAGVVVVTSATPGEGRTTTAANLATAMALAGKRVILIDGDLREPRLSERFGYEGETGLTDVLRGRSRLESEVRLWQADLNLGILPAGGTVDNPSELLSSQALVSVLDTCRRSADVVLIDTPPLLNVTDGSVVAGLSDGALLVVRHGETTMESAAEAAAQLRDADTDLHGVIINHVPGALASRFQFRDNRDVHIAEVPAILTPAVEGVDGDSADEPAESAEPAGTASSESGATAPSGGAKGPGAHRAPAGGTAPRVESAEAGAVNGAATHDVPATGMPVDLTEGTPFGSTKGSATRVGPVNDTAPHVTPGYVSAPHVYPANGVPARGTPSNGAPANGAPANGAAPHVAPANGSAPHVYPANGSSPHVTSAYSQGPQGTSVYGAGTSGPAASGSMPSVPGSVVRRR